MEKKYLKIKATLERCSYGDVSCKGKLLENRMFFQKDPNSDKMLATWTIWNESNYEKNCLYQWINKGLLFKLSELHTGLNFYFWLILRQAEDYDLLYRAEFMKLNATYYLLGNHNIITGPLYVHESDDPNHLRKLISEGKIYVPTTKQLFEEYKKQQYA